jgi:predicted permease
MNGSIIVLTIVPIFLLMGIGYISRRISILRAGDERVLNSYVYYFALPALFTIDLAETSFTRQNLNFILAGILPVLIVTALFLLLYLIFRFSRDTLYLLILTTVFGSLGFFGIPFVMFAFPGQESESLATLSAATISAFSVAISIGVLEFYRLGKVNLWEGTRHIARRLSQNPLILSILVGIFFSLTGLALPVPISKTLHMLGSTTATVAIFLLGVFLYGRTYRNMATAAGLSLLRMALLPIIALGVALLMGLPGIQKTTLVLMHSMPIAISMIVLSERYDFQKETIASLLLLSSLSAGIYLNVWLVLLGL